MSEKKDDGIEPESNEESNSVESNTEGSSTDETSADDLVADETDAEDVGDDETSASAITPDESTPEGEAHSRRRALVILVIVVVLAVVAALVVWSVSNGSSPRAAATAGATTSADPSAPASSGAPTDGGSPAAEAPGGGTVSDDIREFDDNADIGGDVSVALSKIEAIEGEAQGPGEISGPSIRFTVTFTNKSDAAYSLAGAVTNLYFGPDQIPAIPLQGPGGASFPSEVKPGETATGTFIYNVPTDQRDQVRITVDYEAAEPALVFEGPAPK